MAVPVDACNAWLKMELAGTVTFPSALSFSGIRDAVTL